MRHLLIPTLCLFSLLSGCSLLDAPIATDADAGVVLDAAAVLDASAVVDAGEPVCVVDPERLNGVLACQVDEQCPCGAHCALGRCIYECLEGVEDCADGQRCSLFGRCIEAEPEQENPGLEEEIAPPSPAPQGAVTLERMAFEVVTRDQLLALTFSVRDADLGALRVGDGLAAQTVDGEVNLLPEEKPLVNCVDSDEAGFSDGCLLEDLAQGSTHTIYLRPGGPDGEAQEWSVGVFTDRQSERVSVRLVEPRALISDEAQVTGTYEGSVQFIDPAGRAMMNLPVRAEVLGQGDAMKMRLIDELRILSPTGSLWGRPVDGGFTFHWTRYLGERAQGLGDVEVHLALRSQEALSVGAGRWLGGRFDVAVAGWFSDEENLGCFGGQAFCGGQGGDSSPCCGRTRGSTDIKAQAVTMARADLTLFRRSGLDEDAQVRRFDDLAADSESDFTNIRDRIWSEASRSSWDQVVQQLFRLEEANPLLDSRLRTWATLADDSRSLLRCETDRVAPNNYICKGANYRGGPAQNNPVCAPGEAAAMPDRCGRYVRRYCSGQGDDACVHECYQIDFGGDGPEPLTPRSFQRINMELARASLCAERYFCYEPPADETFSTESSRLHRRALPISGDLTCTRTNNDLQDQIPTAIGLFTNADASEAEQEALSAGAMLEACFADLSRPVPDLQGRGPIWDGADLRRVFQTEGCIDLARFWSSLRWASAPAMLQAMDPQTRESDAVGDQSKANGLYLRLMSQWLQLHQFLALEGLQAHRLAKVLRQGEDRITPTEVPSLGRLRQVLGGAWEVFLRPRLVTGLMGVTPEQLLEADYRRVIYPNLNAGAQSFHEQGVGLPVFLVEAMNSYMEVLEAEAEEVWSSGQNLTAHRALMATAVRQSLLMEALAERVAQRADVGESRWGPRYLQARTQLKGLRARVLRASINLLGRGNPLGIEDDDLPLYFRVDQGGQIGRASVISTYFLADRGGLASQAVGSAESALQSARGAWLQLRDGVLQDRNHVVEANARQTATAQRYGDPILEICGAHRGWERPNDPGNTAPVTSAEAVEWLDDIPDYGSCFLDTSKPECRLSQQLLDEAVQPEQLEYQLCKAAVYRYHYGDAVRFADPQSHALATATLDEWLELYEADTLTRERAIEILFSGIAGASAEARRGFFKGFEGVEAVSLEHRNETHDACINALPNALPSMPSYATLEDGPLQKTSCYMGAMGEALLEAMQTAKALEAARASVAERTEAYGIAVTSCEYGQRLGDIENELTRRRNFALAGMRALRLAATVVAEATSHDWKDHLISFGGTVANTGAKVTIQVMNDAMEMAQEQHELLMTQYQNYFSDMICFNDAKLHLVGLKTAQINMEAAVLGTERSVQRARTMASRLDALREEGRVAIARAEGWQRPPVAHDRWLDEDVDGFLNAMRRAKRTVYLAVRAVEYEFQMSREERGAVLAASAPGELDEVLASLRSVTNTQRINGNLPDNYQAIFSLKTHLMQLASRERFPESDYRFNDTQRFRALLNAQRFAVYDEEGAYLGQRIPFKLTPFDLQSNGDRFALPVINSSLDCGERLWSVNLSLDGTGAVPEDSVQRSARVELLQKNSFFSRWCGDGQEGYQTHTVRPERNLFRDPLAGSPQGAQQPRISQFPGWTRARVDAKLNVDPEQFNSENYTENASTELAARGLYGEYALFFPVQMLRASSANGLDLRKLDDVRIRVDFTSFAR